MLSIQNEDEKQKTRRIMRRNKITKIKREREELAKQKTKNEQEETKRPPNWRR